MGLTIRPAYIEGNNQVIDRGAAYVSARDGNRYVVAHQVPGAGAVTGQTSFVATTPTFVLDLSATTKKLVPSRLTLFQTGTVAANPIEIAIAYDNIIRRASGGTAITPSNARKGGDASSAAFWTNPTAASASAVKFIDGAALVASVGSGITFDFQDGLCLPGACSLLIYTFATGTAPTWKYTLEYIEETL